MYVIQISSSLEGCISEAFERLESIDVAVLFDVPAGRFCQPLAVDFGQLYVYLTRTQVYSEE